MHYLSASMISVDQRPAISFLFEPLLLGRGGQLGISFGNLQDFVILQLHLDAERRTVRTSRGRMPTTLPMQRYSTRLSPAIFIGIDNRICIMAPSLRAAAHPSRNRRHTRTRSPISLPFPECGAHRLICANSSTFIFVYACDSIRCTLVLEQVVFPLVSDIPKIFLMEGTDCSIVFAGVGCPLPLQVFTKTLDCRRLILSEWRRV